jgi:hypothetical protein
VRRISSPGKRGIRSRFKNKAILEWTLPASLVGASGDVLSITMTLSYREVEPLAIVLTFVHPEVSRRPIRWVVGRELLEASLKMCSGEGDVHAFRASSAETVMELTNRGGHAVILFDTETLRLFLEESYGIVPVGYESRYLDIDSWIAGLLGDT